ncbi:LAME_0A01838g1_1 [Lachancea meyersii CBS 8951]|uniref:LAME_0A01838g1_1 n=1 Tax=Lachancea meyersii CBS 8951 TaxID=1266667 RepID=A0A1G4IM14_9SACH|nr:LAME_0A01838g1_1 [Lachancea meyersii CBS 8951]
MTQVVFRVPLSPQEQEVFGKEFKKLDPEDLGIVTGEAVKPLFSQSGLSAQVLSQIWALCDSENQGFLNLAQFNAAMRLIGHLQTNPTAPVSPELYQTPAPKLPLVSAPTANLSAVSTGSSNPSSVPAISPYDVAKFSQLFDRSTEGAPNLAGDKAREIFLKAKLPTPTLGLIWNLCDRNNSGTLDKSEFIMAMHLIQLAMVNNPAIGTLSDRLPKYLWDSINMPMGAKPVVSTNSTGASLNSPVSRQPSLNRVPSSTFSNAASDWNLSFEKKQQFDVIFDSLDKNKAGTLGSQILVPFFLSSRLSQDILATVWDLADIHNNAEFSKLEFAIAMFLIQKKKSGINLPDVVPDQLLQSPALGLDASQTYQNASSPLPSVPSRDTKPSFADATQSTERSQSALGDLLTLNESFSSPRPMPTRLASDATAQSVTSVQSPTRSDTMMGTRRFQPSSTFGQSIIQEEPATGTPDLQSDYKAQGSYFNPPVSNQNQGLVSQQPQMQTDQQHVYQQQAFHVSPQESQSPQARGVTPAPYSGTSTHMAQSPVSQVPPTTQQPSISSSLPSVPNFLSPPLQQGSRQLSTSVEPETSMQLSQATTELANLSNQVGSLTNQATLVNERKAKAQQELRRMNDLKASIQSKMVNLRASYEQELKETEQAESQLGQSRLDTEELQRQLAVAEANHHAVQGSLSDLQKQLQESQQSNAQLKEKIGSLNSLASSLQVELNGKQQNVKQERSMVDVNSKQMELSDLTVQNLKSEIEGLEQHIAIFRQKHKELNDYSSTLETQHGELNSRHQQLESRHADLSRRDKELQERNQEIENQERVYHQEIAKLQSMFEDLNAQRESLAKADDDLQSQQLQYAQKVQELSERQMKLAMGELPEDADEIVKNKRDFSPKQDHIARYVDESVTNSRLGAQEDDENKQESDVFDKDIPTAGSQTEVDEEDGRTHDDISAAQALADRFDGDLNEYGIPRTESVTSSVLNNPPQSVCDYPEGDLNTATASGSHIPPASVGEDNTTTDDVENTMPGGWADAQSEGIEDPKTVKGPAPTSPDQDSEVETINKTADEVKDDSAKAAEVTIDDEFPPIQELDIEESDSSDEEENSFQDSKDFTEPKSLRIPDKGPEREVPAKASVIAVGNVNAIPTVGEGSTKSVPAEKEVGDFDDEFDGLEQAAPEEDDADGAGDSNDNDFQEDFERIEHKDLDDELHQGGFTGVSTRETQATSPDAASAVGADEWDEIFAGFGNSKQGSVPVVQPEPVPIKQPVPTKSSVDPVSAPINRGIATTPKSLAVEELASMGFSTEEATKALEQCNWDLGTATNHLLDSS